MRSLFTLVLAALFMFACTVTYANDVGKRDPVPKKELPIFKVVKADVVFQTPQITYQIQPLQTESDIIYVMEPVPTIVLNASIKISYVSIAKDVPNYFFGYSMANSCSNYFVTTII